MKREDEAEHDQRALKQFSLIVALHSVNVEVRTGMWYSRQFQQVDVIPTWELDVRIGNHLVLPEESVCGVETFVVGLRAEVFGRDVAATAGELCISATLECAAELGVRIRADDFSSWNSTIQVLSC